MIVCLVGKSCVGKDTTARQLQQSGFDFVISTTTRPMRDGECQGNPYHFISDETFDKMLADNKFIEHREYNTLVDAIPAIWKYGVCCDAIDNSKDYCAVLDMVGLDGFKKYFNNEVVSFYLDVPDDVRKARCIKRGDYNESEWNRRLIDDNIVFAPDIVKEQVDWKLGNVHNVNAAKEVLSIIECVKNKYL